MKRQGYDYRGLRANAALMAKIDILLNLINFAKDISAIESDLATIGFDSELELVTITQNTIANILNRVVDKEISYDLLEEWANLIGVPRGHRI
ncbi:hypothetical protein [uncultured Campylobacter sp.]|uniref:hypothetical protein n=1 Tax=uncultured Campylobacter sp. TaxID=218934 RepID=UPI0026070298|nr:hypothetical protein [uncultured Campylobacter sp.]